MADLQRMDKQTKKRTGRILNLTLEIIYLLTGEDYKVVKKTSCEYVSNSSLSCSRGWVKRQSLVMESSLTPLIPERNNDKKILEVINKIIELVTGEDVTVYFSSEEEVEELEGHKDLQKGVMMKNRPPLTSSDGSSNSNPPERCPHPLYSWAFTHEDTRATQTEVRTEEEEVLVRIKEEDAPLEISTDGQYKTYTTIKCPPACATQESNYEIEEEMEDEVHILIKEEDISQDISTDGETEDDVITPSSSKENSTTPDLHPLLHIANPSSDPGRLHDRPHFMAHHTARRGAKTFVCSECGQTFPERVDLVVHQRNHTVEKPYACPECGKCYRQRALLNRHQKTHSGEKPYSCPDCGKSFSHSQYLVLHQRSHTGEKPYSCHECGKCFFRSDHLIRHRRFHTGEKPYSCSECGKCFSVRFCLTEHERIHTGERPYSCTECGRGFTSRSNLASHARVHTGHHPYSCSECGKQFSKKSYLISHLSSHGGQEAPVSESDT